MKFNRASRSLAISECGNYEIRIAETSDGRSFHNGWHIPTDKHIEASFDRNIVKAACEAHAKRQLEAA